MSHLLDPVRVQTTNPTSQSTLLEARLRLARRTRQSAGIKQRPTGEPSPLSFSQERLWFLQQLNPDSPVWNRPVACRLYGRLSAPTLERALSEIVRRHEVLHTTFRVEDGTPLQVVAAHLHVPLVALDLTGFPGSERQTQAARHVRAEARRPFDLAAGPLLRALLLRLGEEEHHLLITLHHAVFDGWSAEVLLRELRILYAAFSRGAASPLEDLSVQYADYAVWQRAQLQGEVLEQQLGYWRAQLKDVATLDLPIAQPRSAEKQPAGAHHAFRVSSETAESLKALARSEQATLFMTLLAAFKVLLLRHSGQEDIAMGCPVAGRKETELERLIGCFINTLVIRSDLSGNPPFRTLLNQVRHTALEAFSHQDVPFEKLVEALQPERDPSLSPFFQVFFQLRNYPKQQQEVEGLRLEEYRVDSGVAGFDLTLEFNEDEAGLAGLVAYDATRFDAEAIRHMAEQYLVLLSQIVASPDTRILDYSLVTENAHALLPGPAQALAQPYFEPVTTRFLDIARQNPAQLALQCGQQQISFSELAERSQALALRLVARGLEPGEVVAVTGVRSPMLITSLLAVLSAGGVIMPLDVSLPNERKRVMLEQGGARFLLHVGMGHAGEGWASSLAHVVLLEVDESSGRLVDEPVDALAQAEPGASGAGEAHGSATLPEISPEWPAYLFFTSGTTGTPKGILGVHKGLSHFLAWQRTQFGIGPGDRCAQLTSLSFDVVLRDIFLPLTSAACLCIPERSLSPEEMVSWLAREQVTVVHAVPSVARAWLGEGPPEEPSSSEMLPSLRRVFFAGEALAGALVRRWRARLGKHATLVNLYGPTETTLVKCFFEVPEQVEPGILPVGRALPQAQALVLNGRDVRCGINEPGEVVIRTPFRTRGYINAAAADQARFVPNPHRDDPEDILYRTGDVGYYDAAGLLVLRGRKDHQVKLRGVRVEPEEVSALLLEHANVESCVVVGREVAGEMALVAYVVLHGDVEVESLRRYLADRLPVALVPSAFVTLERLPLLPNGKVDRRALPAPEVGQQKQAYVAPRNEVETALTEIWSTVLRSEKVGIHDNFFDLGGHSLLAVRVASRMQDRLGIEVPLRDFFEAPTIALLAPRIVSNKNTIRDARQGEAPDLAQLLDALEGLSEEEARRLLGE